MELTQEIQKSTKKINSTNVSLNRRHLLRVSGASILGTSVVSQPITAQQSDNNQDGSTDEYIRIQAPLLGMTAEEVSLGSESTGFVSRAVAAEIPNTRTTDVIVRRSTDSSTVEITDSDVSDSQFAEALDSAGYDFATIRDGVTRSTRDETINVIETKLNQAGVPNHSVGQNSSGNEWEIVLQVPKSHREEVIDLIENRGTVQVDVYHREGGEYVTERNVIAQDDFASISRARQGERGIGPHVPVVIAENEAGRVQSTLVDTGVAQSGGSTCSYEEQPNATDPCLLLVSNDEIINSFGMGLDLANTMRSGEWAQSPSFVLTTNTFEEAQDIALDLRSGALPAKIDIDAIEVTSTEVPEEITDSEADGDETEQTADGAPGFGISAAITGLGGAGYLMQQRLSGSESDGE